MAYLPAPSDPVSSTESGDESASSWQRYSLPGVVLALLVAFLIAPWPFEEKAHAVLHGICGQTPGHTLTFDGKLLPLDTRCVGIFAGLLVTFLLLIGLGRSRAAGLPTTGAGILLILFLGAMALDGVNSLMFDLGRWHPYAPSNDLRLLTGWMTGVGIGTVLLMLTGMTLWRRPKVSMRVLPAWWWPFALLAPVAPAWLLLRTGSMFVFYPASLLLIAAAVTAFATLAVCAIIMLRNADNSYTRFWQVAPLAAAGVLIAVAILLAMGGGRFWLEQHFGFASGV